MPTGFEKLVAEAKKKITEISPTEAAEKSKSGERSSSTSKKKSRTLTQ
jgi:hypothetical protein